MNIGDDYAKCCQFWIYQNDIALLLKQLNKDLLMNLRILQNIGKRSKMGKWGSSYPSTTIVFFFFLFFFAKMRQTRTAREYHSFFCSNTFRILPSNLDKILQQMWLANQWTGFYMITASVIKELRILLNGF